MLRDQILLELFILTNYDAKNFDCFFLLDYSVAHLEVEKLVVVVPPFVLDDQVRLLRVELKMVTVHVPLHLGCLDSHSDSVLKLISV